MIELHAALLFTYDARGRMVMTNEPLVSARRPAPRAFVVRDAERRIVRLAATMSDELVDASDATLAALGLAEHGRCYRFPDAIAPSRAVAITRDNCDVARATFPWLADEIDDWQPCFGAVVAGAVVSIAFSARSSHAGAEAGVETLAAHRGRGYATDVTLAWAAAIRASGRVPLYSTSADNLASQAVARRCGLVAYGSSTSWA